MKLAEMAIDYENSAQRISGRLSQLRSSLRASPTEEEAFHLRRRIAELKPMLTQCRKLSNVTAHYYDRSFYGYDEYRI